MKAFAFLTALIGFAAASPVAAVAEEAGLDARANHVDMLQPIVHGRTYTIRSDLDDNLVLDLAASQPTGDVLAYAYHGGPNQQWKAYQAGGVFGFQNVATKTWITAPDSNNGGAVKCARESPDRVQLQKWYIQPVSNNIVVLRSVPRPNLVLDINGGQPVSGTNIITYPLKSSGTENQQWRFVPV